jgi:hypothetical protein
MTHPKYATGACTSSPWWSAWAPLRVSPPDSP